MQIKEIYIVDEIENIFDDSIDVIVTLEDGFSYSVAVATPEYLLSRMNEENLNFLEPGENFIIVRKLTSEIIEEALIEFTKEANAYWLKWHHIASYLDNETLNNLRDDVIRKYSGKD